MKSVPMNEDILNVINAVVDYGRWIRSHDYVVKADDAQDYVAAMENYYHSLPLPEGMSKNKADFERILQIGWYSDEELERLNNLEFSDLNSVRWKYDDERKSMTFNDFIYADKSLAMVITVEEYNHIKPLLKEFYSERHIKDIDDSCKYAWADRKFLLCNLRLKDEIGTSMMLENAVTFVDRVPFEKIDFSVSLEQKLSGAVERSAETGHGKVGKDEFVKD